MRKGAELAQTLPTEWIERLNQSLAASQEGMRILEDPVMLAAFRRANRAEVLHWANANLRARRTRADILDTARELVHRGEGSY